MAQPPKRRGHEVGLVLLAERFQVVDLVEDGFMPVPFPVRPRTTRKQSTPKRNVDVATNQNSQENDVPKGMRHGHVCILLVFIPVNPPPHGVGTEATSRRRLLEFVLPRQ